MRSWNYIYIYGIALKYSQHLKTPVAFHGCLCFSGQAALMNARAWWMRPLTDLGRNDLMVTGKQAVVSSKLVLQIIGTEWRCTFHLQHSQYDLKDVHGCPTCHARSITMLQPLRPSPSNQHPSTIKHAETGQPRQIKGIYLFQGPPKNAWEKWNTVIFKLSTIL